MLGCHLNKTLSMTPKGAQYANLVGWPKTRLQQSHRMQILDPLTVRNVALAPRNVLHVMCVNQEDFEPVRFQDLIYRDPVNASRLHGYRPDVALAQPIGQIDQISSEGTEPTDRIDVTIRRNSNKYLFGADINPRSIGVHDRQHPSTQLAPGPAGHRWLLLLEPAARGYVTNKLLNGIAAQNGRHHRPLRDLGPTLNNGLCVSTNVDAGL